ncbi:hypothetical protein X566_12370 [Afipia sp. P52-10]|nr:hypothetical protein X566_12370 [Afipia sp. P52-10]
MILDHIKRRVRWALLARAPALRAITHTGRMGSGPARNRASRNDGKEWSGASIHSRAHTFSASARSAIDPPHAAMIRRGTNHRHEIWRAPTRASGDATMQRISQRQSSKLLAAPLMLVAALALSGCFKSGREVAATAATDDEATCRAKGQPGSDAYAVCLKERDIAREGAQARVDRAHRRVSEDMLMGR